MAATVLHPLTTPEADAIARVLHSVEHIDIALTIGDGRVDVRPAVRPLTTAEEVRALRAVTAVTDARVDWRPEVAR